jgi:Zn ribbon nucleic-acid-binding protein
MFEDEVDEVGSDVEAYCPKCKADTTHVVISKYEDEIRRVQCNPCGDVHSFRKPRGEVEDDVPEPIAAKKRALIKKHSWEEFFAKYPDRNGKPYEFREAYTENTIVTHPKFGKGFVSELMSDSKVEITFKDARRVLVHNRKDMPGLPLAAEGDGIPSKGPKAKAVKSKAAAKESKESKESKDTQGPQGPQGAQGLAGPPGPQVSKASKGSKEPKEPKDAGAKEGGPKEATRDGVKESSKDAAHPPAKGAAGASPAAPSGGQTAPPKAGAPAKVAPASPSGPAKGTAASAKPPKAAASAKPAKHVVKPAAKPAGKAAHASKAVKETSKVAAKAKPKAGKSKPSAKKKR